MEASARLLAQAEPRIKAIYETNEFRMRSFRVTWLQDGSGYQKLETPDGTAGREISAGWATPTRRRSKAQSICETFGSRCFHDVLNGPVQLSRVARAKAHEDAVQMSRRS